MSDKSLVIGFPPKPNDKPPIYCGNGFAMQRADGLWECRVTTPPIYGLTSEEVAARAGKR